VLPRKGFTLSATKVNCEESMIFLISSELNLVALCEDEQRIRKSGITRMRKENFINFKTISVFMALF
jgi:hypothetical protein